jgi:hypothetical protein
MAFVVLTVRVSPDQYERLGQVADENSGLTRSGLARMAVDELLRDPAVFLANAMTHRQQNGYANGAKAVEVPA